MGRFGTLPTLLNAAPYWKSRTKLATFAKLPSVQGATLCPRCGAATFDFDFDRTEGLRPFGENLGHNAKATRSTIKSFDRTEGLRPFGENLSHNAKAVRSTIKSLVPKGRSPSI